MPCLLEGPPRSSATGAWGPRQNQLCLPEHTRDRRRFVKTAAGGAAGSALIAAPVIAPSQPKISWRLTASYPKSLDTLFGLSIGVSKRVAEATDGNFQIQVFAPGEIVPGLQALDAVQNGTVECSHTLSSFYIGKDPAFAFETSLPFGFNTRQQNAWLYAGGGLELCRAFMRQHGLYTIPSGNTDALIRLAGAGAEPRPFPREVMAAAFKVAFAMDAELAAKNAEFKTFYDSFLPYWKTENLWFRVAELPFDAFNAQMSQQMR